jgi:hypothetical protein
LEKLLSLEKADEAKYNVEKLISYEHCFVFSRSITKNDIVGGKKVMLEYGLRNQVC